MSASRKPNEQLRHARKLKGWTQLAVADALSIDAKTVSRWERRIQLPGPHHRQRLCQLFHMDVIALGLIEPCLSHQAVAHAVTARIDEHDASADPHHITPVKPGPRDLPPRAPGFVGHEEDVQSVCAALCQRHHVALLGMGGIGKSSLAAEVVYTHMADPRAFPGGVTWVRCDTHAGLAGVSWIADQLLAAWDAPHVAEALRAVTTPEEGVLVRERALRKRILGQHPTMPDPALVLLDNVERGLALNRLLEILTPLAITVLLTARSEPASPHLLLVRLDVLSPDAALRLFAERYNDRGGLWQVAQDTKAATAICATLGYLPLAIELAAARTARMHLPLTAVATEMRAITGLSRLCDPLEPSASVRYSLSTTLTMLTPTQQSCFASLGLPVGSDWPVAVIEQMRVGVPPQPDNAAAQQELEVLAAHSLVSFLPRVGGQYLRMHPLLRELAREEWTRQSNEVKQAVLAGLLVGVNAWVTRHHTNMRVLAHDSDLIASALRAAAACQMELPLLLDTIDALGNYLVFRDAFLGLELRTLEVQIARALGDRVRELVALPKLASAHQWLGYRVEEGQLLREALALARDVSDPILLIHILCKWVVYDLANGGSQPEAQEYYQEACALARALADATTPAVILLDIGEVASLLGDLDVGKSLMEQALVRCQASGEWMNEFGCLHNLGDISALLGDDGAARAYHEQELAQGIAHAEIGDGIGITYDRLGEIALRAGDLALASHHFQAAIRSDEAFNETHLLPHYRANLLVVQGEVARQQGNFAEARQRYQEALAITEPAPTPYSHYAREYITFVHTRIALLDQHADAVGEKARPTDVRARNESRRFGS